MFDEIEKLKARLAQLEEALHDIENLWMENTYSETEPDEYEEGYEDGLGEAAKIARNALRRLP